MHNGTMKAKIVVSLLLPLMSSCSPHGFYVSFGESSSSGISKGPGVGGAPVLVDTSAHMINYKARAVENYDSPLRVTLKTSPPQDIVNTKTAQKLPIIRPATNLPDQDERRKVTLSEEPSMFNAFLRHLYTFWTQSVQPTMTAPPIEAKPVQNEDDDGDDTKIRIRILPKQVDGEGKPDTVERPPAAAIPAYLQRLTMARSRAVAREYGSDAGDKLPVIRPATNVDKLPIIRPATNVN